MKNVENHIVLKKIQSLLKNLLLPARGFYYNERCCGLLRTPSVCLHGGMIAMKREVAAPGVEQVFRGAKVMLGN